MALVFWAFGAFAAEPWQQWLSEAEFTALASRLARNVDLFQAVWEKDPQAVFYGGTSRDFLWFVRGECAKATSREDLARRIEALEKRPIGINEFIVGLSDVDVITDKDLSGVAFDKSALSKLEKISPAWFKPDSAFFAQEQKQGYIPVEKIGIGHEGIVRHPALPEADGTSEIYRGRPSLHFDPRIVETDLYKRRENHPALLALRYLRQVAMAYFRLHGSDYPDKEKLFSLIDAKSKSNLETILNGMRKNPDQLGKFLENDRLKSRLDSVLAKVFRSYTNPTAAKLLFDEFQIDPILEHYGGRIAPYHTVMYKKHRDADLIAKHRAELGFTPSTVGESMKEPVVYHGTGSMANYRNILFQGNLPSEGGTAGVGVYAVDIRSIAFAKKWRGEKTLVAKLLLDPKATYVDITEGPGRAAFGKFVNGHPTEKDPWTAFADYIGADVVKYPYEEQAYVIKNGSAITGYEGETLKLMTIPQARAYITSHASNPGALRRLLDFDPSLKPHASYLVNGLSQTKAFEQLLLALADDRRPFQALNGVRESSPHRFTPAEWRELYRAQYPVALALLDEYVRVDHRTPMTGVDATVTLSEILSRPNYFPPEEFLASFAKWLDEHGEAAYRKRGVSFGTELNHESRYRRLIGEAVASIPKWEDAQWRYFFLAAPKLEYVTGVNKLLNAFRSQTSVPSTSAVHAMEAPEKGAARIMENFDWKANDLWSELVGKLTSNLPADEKLAMEDRLQTAVHERIVRWDRHWSSYHEEFAGDCDRFARAVEFLFGLPGRTALSIEAFVKEVERLPPEAIIIALARLHARRPELAGKDAWARLFVTWGNTLLAKVEKMIDIRGNDKPTLKAARQMLIYYLVIPPEYRPLTSDEFVARAKRWPEAIVPLLTDDPHLARWSCSGSLRHLAAP